MSNPSQSLSLLLPTLSSALPPELLSLSASLLAQSHTKAANLKPEEEIARPYACSEIACKRLSAKLRLPALQNARPPCPPRVYKKLLAFLEGRLEAGLPTTTGTTPRKDATGPRNGEGVTARGTPRKGIPKPGQTTPRKRNTAFAGTIAESALQTQDRNNDDGAPPWAMPLIRRLCSTLSTPLLPPHVYTGLCVVSKLLANSSPPPPQQQHEHPPPHPLALQSLTLALFFLVLSRMQRGKVSTTSYTADCDQACAVVANAAADIRPSHPDRRSVTREQVDAMIKRVSIQGWTTGQEWWHSVPENVFDRQPLQAPPPPPPPPQDDDDQVGTEAVAEAEELANDITLPRPNPKKRQRRNGHDAAADPAADTDPNSDPDSDSDRTLRPGLGTMMQESVDWLSRDRRAEYREWRAGIERRINNAQTESRGRGGQKTATTTGRKAQTAGRAAAVAAVAVMGTGMGTGKRRRGRVVAVG